MKILNIYCLLDLWLYYFLLWLAIGTATFIENEYDTITAKEL